MAPRLARLSALTIPVALLLADGDAHAAEPIRTHDLRALFGAAPGSVAERRQAYDTLVAATCLQGIVNRSSPDLYLFYVTSVVDGSIDTDQLWFDRMSDPKIGAGILDGRTVVALTGLEEALQTYAARLQGLVVWDEKVPATVNAAFTAAGADDLIAVRWDSDPASLFQKLQATLPVKVWLVNQDGSSRFLDKQGSGLVPDTSRQTSQSAKADAYVWALEKYLKVPGKLDPTEFGWMLDARWINTPQQYDGSMTATNQWQITNRDFLVARRGLPFDLSPWSDVPATDDPGQPVGTDPAILKELMAAARAGAGGEVITIRGFFGWQFKYTTLEGLPAGHEPVMGEWTSVQLVSPWAVGLDADAPGVATMANASFFSHVPLDENVAPQPRPTPEDLVGAGFLSGLAGNGGFEDGESGWVVHTTNHVVYTDPASGPAVARTGLRRIEVNTAAVGDDMQDNLYRDGPGVAAGQRVTLRAFVRAPAGSVQGQAVIWALGGSTEQAVTSFTAGSEWTEVRATLDVTGAGHTSTRGQIYLKTAGANLDLDDVAFYQGDAASGSVEPANYVLWFVGDYDAASWIYEFSPVTWDRPGRGLVPLAWDFSTHVATRFPLFFRHALATRTARDFFIGADSGPGYGNPGVMDAASRSIWTRAGVRNARRLDTSAAWILNPLDPLDAEHLGACTPFTGDGVLLMSAGGVSTPSIVDHAPVLALDNLPGDTVADMTSAIVGASPAPSQPSFHAFREVLKPTTDLVAVTHALVEDHADRKLRVVDPYTFLELARHKLGGSNSWRASFKDVSLESPVVVGKGAHLEFKVRNDGWETWRAAAPQQYRIGLNVSSSPPDPRTLPTDGAAYPTRLSLPADVPPGGEVALSVDLPAAATVGRWTLQGDVVQEGVTWFESQGDIPMQRTLVVVDALPDAGVDGQVDAPGSEGGKTDSSAPADGSLVDSPAQQQEGGAGASSFQGASDDDGCGCRAAGARQDRWSWMGWLAAGWMMRRRLRNRRALWPTASGT